MKKFQKEVVQLLDDCCTLLKVKVFDVNSRILLVNKLNDLCELLKDDDYKEIASELLDQKEYLTKIILDINNYTLKIKGNTEITEMLNDLRKTITKVPKFVSTQEVKELVKKYQMKKLNTDDRGESIIKLYIINNILITVEQPKDNLDKCIIKGAYELGIFNNNYKLLCELIKLKGLSGVKVRSWSPVTRDDLPNFLAVKVKNNLESLTELINTVKSNTNQDIEQETKINMYIKERKIKNPDDFAQYVDNIYIRYLNDSKELIRDLLFSKK